MDKSEQVLAGLWDLFSKRMWLDEFRMKAALKEYTPVSYTHLKRTVFYFRPFRPANRAAVNTC